MAHVFLEGRPGGKTTYVYGLAEAFEEEEERCLSVLQELGVGRRKPAGGGSVSVDLPPSTVMNRLHKEGFKVLCSAMLTEVYICWTLGKDG